MKQSKFARLSAGVSVMALGVAVMGFALPALAQTATGEADVTEVIVTGQRAQIKTAQKLKKDAEVVVDSVTAVDIGALPDRSVAEALQRISGIQIQRTSAARDPIRMTAEGGGVVIRGLTWVRSETNGRDIFSAANGRSLSFEDVSADLLAGVDVYKNPSADMIEGGIGGTVNLRTRQPFDSRGRVLAGTFDSTYGDLQEKRQNSISVLYSDRWKTSIGEVGLLINYSNADSGNETHVIGVDRYNQVGSGASARYIPNTLGWRIIDWEQNRQAGAIALQWRPNDSLEFSLQAFKSKATPKNVEYNTGFYNDTGELTSAQSMATYKYNDKGEFVSGTVYGAGITANTRYGNDVKETEDVSLNARWYVNDKLTLTGDLQYVKSTADILSNTAFVQYCANRVTTDTCAASDKTVVSIDMNGELPTIRMLTSDTANKSNYYWAAAMDHVEKNEATQYSARIDGQYEFDDNSWLKSFKFGVRATDRDYLTRQSTWNWGYLSHQYWGSGGGTGAVFLDQTGGYGSVPANPDLPGLSELVTFDGFMGGQSAVPGNIWFPSAALVKSPQGMYSELQAVETAGWGWSPIGLDNIGPEGINDQSEKTKAAYGLLRVGGELSGFGQSWDGNIGVRVVKTEVNTAGAVVSGADANFGTCVVSGSVTAAQCAAYNNAKQFKATALTGVAYGGSNEYTDVMPSLNLRFKYSSELQFRFAASKAIVRPDMSWLSGYTTLSAGASTGDFTLNPTGQGGNPFLKPVEANQYDLTAEWYFAPTSSLTLALFRKDLTNYIYVQSTPETYTNNGATMTFNVNRYVNGSEKGEVSGFEIAYNQFYDFLPGFWSGFGVQANYTKIESSGGRNPVASVSDGNQVTNANISGLPLEGMSPDSYNFALLYEKYGISARMAYNWRSEYLYTTSAANVNRPMWAGDYGQWDGSVFYSLTPKVKVGIQATNIGRDIAYTRVSSDVAKPLETQYYSATKTDRRVALILRASF
ncbi:TonB-dependent receptor [Asticcacaulis excentricus]|uniref:TonB-dependent receptor n=1 Tax=Asticcacaulis excentricus (strain ATCC 15261 / DSM 4724 / KCTC 12464 / NCIMB 9791 / VKM B-1370 / CB 48) TaxID=573065 RepID=E8RKM4_ASTEC|nr:TonB-dependent receptor [Asticcacaulis excentricus]ADU13558.1 TonB-dependent receptor [Asticcacaulis excentricus CB 48]